jgi:hypothetical protein
VNPMNDAVQKLEFAIETWLAQRNSKPKPFKWTAKANIIPHAL